ncbi:ferric iron uptake transcriptional regulator [Psychromonas sp. MME2]|uniref:ferric iron uptake transcriptional regulator n=1 Tax=unclassified Psychromonas TaxID=2614957 RepID=UPI00339C53CD
MPFNNDAKEAIKKEALKKIIKNAGLKATAQRVKILGLLQLEDNQHISAEDLYKKLLEGQDDNVSGSVGVATVYRVLNQFDEAGLLTRHHFEGGKSLFELANQHHHDHLICLKCGEVIEFTDDSIEKLQHKIAQQHGIKLSSHSLYLYGEPIDGVCNHK